MRLVGKQEPNVTVVINDNVPHFGKICTGWMLCDACDAVPFPHIGLCRVLWV